MFDIIVAIDSNNGIGKRNKLPWKIKQDMDFFKKKTTFTPYPESYNVVIMGYNTWKSIPERNKPLDDRINIVITNNHQEEFSDDSTKSDEKSYNFITDIHTATSFQNALDMAYSLKVVNNIFVIGGKKVYEEALTHPDLRHLYSTKLMNDYKCDTQINYSNSNFEIIYESDTNLYLDKKLDDEVELQFITLKKLEHPETKYLNLIEKIIDKGNKRATRNATTISLFGEQLKFDISNSFPLLTTKKMFWKGVVEELLFFLRGDTDSNKLNDKGVKIWNPNTSRDFLDNLGLTDYKEGEMGPMYGYQWRNFNKPYRDETNSGYDQLANCIDLIKNNPTNRRIMMTTFNPLQLTESVLAPCHSIIIQFYVNDNKLSCHMYQRSADTFLGLPFNIASTSLLTCIIAKVTNLDPGEVIISLGDTHLYDEHVEAALKQLERTPKQFPKLEIKKEIKNINDIETLSYSDFELINYQCHPGIKANMIA